MWEIAGIIILIVGAILVWRSIKIVNGIEMAVLVIFGKPRKFWDSGIHFDPRLIFGKRLGCYLARYPKLVYNLTYPQKRVITKEGEYRERKYGSQVIEVSATAYLSFPRKKRIIEGKEEKEHPLLEIFRSAIPIEKEKLQDWTEESISSALRVAFGEVTWRQAIEELDKIRERAQQELTRKDGTLVRVGFDPDDIRLTIPEIRLPPEVEEVLTTYEKERIEAEAAPFEAKERALETVGTVIEMLAHARGKTVEEIKSEIDKDPELKKEFLTMAKDYIVREMALRKDAYVDIRVIGAEGLERTLLNALAAWKRMPMGERERKERKKRREGELVY